VLGHEQEDRHLGSRDRAVWAVVASATTARDSVAEDLLDKVVESVRLRDIQEVGKEGPRQFVRRKIKLRDDEVVQRARRKRRGGCVDLTRADQADARLPEKLCSVVNGEPLVSILNIVPLLLAPPPLVVP
jgi:hypothetical protein